TEIHSGEKITLRCEIEGGDDSEWEYEWKTTSSDRSVRQSESFEITATSHSEGEYKCKGKHKTEVLSSTPWSTPIRLTVSDRAVVTLQPHWTEIYSGEKITLRCEIEGGDDSEWEYEWETTSSDRSVRQSESFEITATSYREGEYKCKGKHKTEVLSSTQWSTPITLTVSAQKPKAELKADVTDIPVGGYVTLTCDVSSSSGWQYYFWYRADKSSNPSSIHDVSSAGQKRVSKEGLYRCRGERGNPVYYTEDSNTIQLKENSKFCILTFFGLITLRCEIKDGDDAEWEYEWKTSNSFKPPKEKEYSIGPADTSHSGNYSCKGRKKSDQSPTGWSDPITLTVLSSSPQPVLTVPERAQHFISDSVSLECKGNSTQWRVKFQEDSSLADCSLWDKMTGSTCTIEEYRSRNNVYWCESGSGEFSNAVNITKQKYEIILVSPVHPVTEGSSVILSCRLRSSDIVSNVFFYQNNKLIQNDTRKELNISAVSKSDEGFYKCQTSGRESSQSWMSVKGEWDSQGDTPLVLIILLLLLYRCRQSKGETFI
uniref:Ig-like domain-containing protein n=1 Tax=Labrus bergylta TaxID=56723 RepID=A0A3Q3FSA1_9LABR